MQWNLWWRGLRDRTCPRCQNNGTCVSGTQSPHSEWPRFASLWFSICPRVSPADLGNHGTFGEFPKMGRYPKMDVLQFRKKHDENMDDNYRSTPMTIWTHGILHIFFLANLPGGAASVPKASRAHTASFWDVPMTAATRGDCDAETGSCACFVGYLQEDCSETTNWKACRMIDQGHSNSLQIGNSHSANTGNNDGKNVNSNSSQSSSAPSSASSSRSTTIVHAT